MDVTPQPPCAFLVRIEVYVDVPRIFPPAWGERAHKVASFSVIYPKVRGVYTRLPAS